MTHREPWEGDEVDAREGTLKFQEADGLFRAGRYAEALVLLEELDAAFPNTKNIVYPRAMCLGKVQQWDAAILACDQLSQQLGDPRGETLKAQLEAARGASEADPFGGLNMAGLDDLLAPRPKKTTVVARPAPSNTSRYIVIGLIMLAVLGAVGGAGWAYQKGLIGGAKEKVEDVEAKLIDTLDKAKSVSLMLDVQASKKDSKGDEVRAAGTLDAMEKDSKHFMRLDGSCMMKQSGMSMNMSAVMVMDGKDMYMQMDMMGKPMVMKQAMPASSGDSMSLKGALEELHKNCDATMLPEETLDGAKAYAIKLMPKAGASGNEMMSKVADGMDSMKLSFTKGELTQASLTAFDATGGTVATVKLKDIRLNADLKEDKFKYTPPEGAQVMDMSTMSGMMGGMGGIPGMK